MIRRYGLEPISKNLPPILWRQGWSAFFQWTLVLALLTPFCLAATTHASDTLSPPNLKTVHLQADRIQIEPDRDHIIATGHVQLDAGDLTIRASTLTLQLPQGIGELHAPFSVGYGNFTIAGQHLVFNQQTNSLRLHSPTLSLSNTSPIHIRGDRGVCHGGTCSLTDMHGTACPHQPTGYEVRAEKVTVHPSGDIDLYKPVVRVDRTPIAALPWIRLRPPDAAGFLFPRLGYDQKGGFVIGPAGYIPIGPNVSAEGYIAVRTAEGFESRSKLTAPNLELSLDHITHLPETDVQLHAQGLAHLKSTTAAMSLHLATNRKIIDDMAENPLDRVLTHTMSRGLLLADFDHLLLETYTGFLQTFDGKGNPELSVLTPSASIELSLPSIPVARFFWPAFDVRFTRHGLPDQAAYRDSTMSPTPGHTRLEFSPRISIPATLGPLRTQLHMGTRHHIWLADTSAVSTKSTHLAGLEVDIRVPLVRTFKEFSHLIEPMLRYRLTPWRSGENPSWVVDDFDRLRTGHGIEAGVVTRFDPVRSSEVLIELTERIDLPGFGDSFAPAYLYGKAIAGPPWMKLTLDGAWDHRHTTPSLAGIALSSLHGEGNSIDLGTRWVGPGRGPHVDRPFSSAFGPWLVSLWSYQAQEQIEVFENLTVSLTRKLRANIGSRLGVWPNPILHALWYGLEFRSSCGCIGAGIIASHRLASFVPDVMVTVTLMGF